MEFGQVDDLGDVDFTIPADHPGTAKRLKTQASKSSELEVYVGCAKWNKRDLKNFYPRGTKNELAYYATQFNSINCPFPKRLMTRGCFKTQTLNTPRNPRTA